MSVFSWENTLLGARQNMMEYTSLFLSQKVHFLVKGNIWQYQTRFKWKVDGMDFVVLTVFNIFLNHLPFPLVWFLPFPSIITECQSLTDLQLLFQFLSFLQHWINPSSSSKSIVLTSTNDVIIQMYEPNTEMHRSLKPLYVFILHNRPREHV